MFHVKHYVLKMKALINTILGTKLEPIIQPSKAIIGKLGEELASRFLVKRGFKLIDRNYREKWGELDIVARDNRDTLHFIEVKTVSRETFPGVSRETDTYRAEDNIHLWKLKRLSRTIQSFLFKNKIRDENWVFDVVVVYLVVGRKQAKVSLIENIIL